MKFSEGYYSKRIQQIYNNKGVSKLLIVKPILIQTLAQIFLILLKNLIKDLGLPSYFLQYLKEIKENRWKMVVNSVITVGVEKTFFSLS